MAGKSGVERSSGSVNIQALMKDKKNGKHGRVLETAEEKDDSLWWWLAFDDLLNEDDGRMLAAFSRLKTDKEKIRFCLSSPFITKTVEKWMKNSAKVFTGKSASLALKLRNDGNTEFQKKNYESAVKCYTQSIFHAPTRYEEGKENSLSLGYANRSAAFYHLNENQACLDDIDRALNLQYPAILEYKLHLRRAHVFLRLRKVQECIEASNATLNCLEKNNELSKKRRDSLQNEVLEVLRLNAQVNSSEPPVTSEETAVPPEVSYGHHPYMVCASEALNMHYSDKQGRYILAKRDIKAGDVLFVEKPYVSVLLPQCEGSYCHHCHIKTEALLPCSNCSIVGYCSPECVEDAYARYHRVECDCLTILHRVGLGHLAFRVVVETGVPFFLNLKTVHEVEAAADALAQKLERPYGTDYLSVYALVAHTESIVNEDMLLYSVTSSLLLKLLEKELDRHKATDDQKLFVGSLILRHTEQLICNAHAIAEIQCRDDPDCSWMQTKSQNRIATAIYPSASLMNHSCDPNIFSSFQKNTLIVRAVKDIPVGGEVLNCYGPHYCRMGRAERRASLLQQYSFTCQCEKCTEDEKNEQIFKAFLCKACKGPVVENTCVECRKKQDCSGYEKACDDTLDLFDRAVRFVEEGNMKDALPLARTCRDQRIKILYKYHEALVETHDLAARCAAFCGQFDEAATYLDICVEATEKKYGAHSIELAHELQKMCDVLYSVAAMDKRCNGAEHFDEIRRVADRALKMLRRGLAIFQTHYGSIHSSTKEIEEKIHAFVELMETLE